MYHEGVEDQVFHAAKDVTKKAANFESFTVSAARCNCISQGEAKLVYSLAYDSFPLPLSSSLVTLLSPSAYSDFTAVGWSLGTSTLVPKAILGKNSLR